MMLSPRLDTWLVQLSQEQLTILLIDPNPIFRQIAQYEMRRREELPDDK